MTLIDFRLPRAEQEALRFKGKHVVCWGSSGSGKTSLATNLAFEFARQGHKVILVDADSYHPSVASLLGLTDSGSGIAACLRLCRKGRFEITELDRLGQRIDFEDRAIEVITGIPLESRWPELDAATLHELARILSETSDFIVWDVASYRELAIFGSETATSRNEATNTLVELADLTIGLFLADPVGVNRFFYDCKEVARDFWPVANRVRSSVLGKRPERELSRVLADVVGLELVESIREDAGFDAMLATAKPLRLQGRSSKALEAISRLANRAADYLEE